MNINEVKYIPDLAGAKGSKSSQYIYYGFPNDPQVGDIRISFQVVPQMVVSIIAKQNNDQTLGPYKTSNNKKIEILEEGAMNAKSMFSNAQTKNTLLGWALRVLGFSLIVLGFKMLMKPLTLLTSFTPLLGNLANVGLDFIAIGLALPLTTITIGVSWISHRPQIGISIISISSIGFIYFFKNKKKINSLSQSSTHGAPTELRRPTNNKVTSARKQKSKFSPDEKAKFLLHGKNKKFGPFTADKIQSYLDSGKIKLTTKASIIGENGMIRVADIVHETKKAS